MNDFMVLNKLDNLRIELEAYMLMRDNLQKLIEVCHPYQFNQFMRKKLITTARILQIQDDISQIIREN